MRYNSLSAADQAAVSSIPADLLEAMGRFDPWMLKHAEPTLRQNYRKKAIPDQAAVWSGIAHVQVRGTVAV